MDEIENPSGIDAAIIFEGNKLKMVVPDVIEVLPGQSLKWIITPSGHDVELSFLDQNDSPVDWPAMKNNTEIAGRVKREAIGEYKYFVTAGRNKIDPHIRVKR